jgi:hypothetical protein
MTVREFLSDIKALPKEPELNALPTALHGDHHHPEPCPLTVLPSPWSLRSPLKVVSLPYR